MMMTIVVLSPQQQQLPQSVALFSSFSLAGVFSSPPQQGHILQGPQRVFYGTVRCRHSRDSWQKDTSQTRRYVGNGLRDQKLKRTRRRVTDTHDQREGQRQHVRLEPDISPHRAVAVVRLLRIEEGGAYADVLSGVGEKSWEDEMAYLGRTLGFRTLELDLRARRLVTDEVAGVVRWKRYLDFLILSFFKRDLQDYERMEPLLRQILRVGIYELVKLEMAPHAVLNETVKLAKVALRPGAGNMVNGLLRSVLACQEMGKLPFPSSEGNDKRSRARALATIHSHPVWMVRRWMAHFGEENTVRLMECNNQRPIFAVRANSAQGVSRADLISELEKLELLRD